MAYTLTSWQDTPSTSTPINSTNLLRYNTAISDLDTRLIATQPAMAVTAVKNANYTAVVNQFVPVDTTNASVTVTLPPAPANGTMFGAQQVIRGGTNTVTLQLSGSDKFNTTTGPTTATLTLLNQGALYQYVSSTAVWLNVGQSPGTGGGAAVTSVTAADTTITVAGGATTPTIAVNAISEAKVTNLTSDLALKAPLASPTFTGTVSTAALTASGLLTTAAVTTNGAVTFGSARYATVDLLTDAATVAVDASLGNYYRLTLGATGHTMGNPTNPTDSQMIMFEIISGGAFTFSWGASYAWGSDVVVPSLSQTAGKRDYVGFVYSAAALKWFGIAVARGY